MSKELLAELSRPFEPEAIKQRPGGGSKALSYVETHSVIHRLNDATGGVWDFRVISLDWREGLLVATVELTIPGLGTRQHIGIQEIKGNVTDLAKGAISDAFKKVCTLFGVGLHLYGPDYAEEAKPPAPDPRIAVLDALRDEAERLELTAFLDGGSLKMRSKFARLICNETGRTIPTDATMTAEDISHAVANIAKWNLQRKAQAIAQRPAQIASSPNLPYPDTDPDPPFDSGVLFPAPEPSQVVHGVYSDQEAIANRAGNPQPTGGRRKVS